MILRQISLLRKLDTLGDYVGIPREVVHLVTKLQSKGKLTKSELFAVIGRGLKELETYLTELDVKFRKANAVSRYYEIITKKSAFFDSNKEIDFQAIGKYIQNRNPQLQDNSQLPELKPDIEKEFLEIPQTDTPLRLPKRPPHFGNGRRKIDFECD